MNVKGVWIKWFISIQRQSVGIVVYVMYHSLARMPLLTTSKANIYEYFLFPVSIVRRSSPAPVKDAPMSILIIGNKTKCQNFWQNNSWIKKGCYCSWLFSNIKSNIQIRYLCWHEEVQMRRYYLRFGFFPQLFHKKYKKKIIHMFLQICKDCSWVWILLSEKLAWKKWFILIRWLNGGLAKYVKCLSNATMLLLIILRDSIYEYCPILVSIVKHNSPVVVKDVNIYSSNTNKRTKWQNFTPNKLLTGKFFSSK